MKRPGRLALLLGLAGLGMTGVLSLGLIWDRLPTDSANWPGAAERAGARAREQARAEQAAEAWSRMLSESLACGGDMATVWARHRSAPAAGSADLPAVAQALRPLAEACRSRLPQLNQVWLLPAPGQTERAQPVLVDVPPSPLGRLSERTLSRLREAAETESDNYTVASGDAAGVDQIVPVRRLAGALLLLRLRPDPATDEGMAMPPLLDEQASAQGIPIRQARGLRVAIASDAAERQWLSLTVLALMLLVTAAAAWYAWLQTRHQRLLLEQIRIAEMATAQARQAESEAETARLQTEAANERLQGEMALRRDIEDASPVGMRVIDRQGRITDVNRAFCEAAGVSAEALIDQEPPYSFWPPEAHDERRDHLNDILSGQVQGEGYRVELLSADGSRWTAQVRATALRSGRGWLLTSEDVTEAERRQKQIDQLHAELQRQGNSYLMGEQALQLVHDLTTPAKAIDQAALNLDRSGRSVLSGPMRLELAVIRQQVVHQHQLIAHFTGQVKGELVYELCDLAKVVDEAFALQSHQARLCNAPLFNRVNIRLPMQRLARINLLHVLINLIGNALQWMATSPMMFRQVVVEDWIDSHPPSPEHPSGHHWLHLKVKDRGCGIPSSDWERIFESGFSTRNDGQGIGLWLCRLWIERMGGEIAVKESSSRGTVMRIVLPFQPAEENADVAAN